jgi:uncharacterized protein (TIGR02117 family)
LKRRPWLSGFGLAAAGLLLYLFAPSPAPSVSAPSAADCVELRLYSNGFHSDIAAPASIFPEAHPLRRLYPEAGSFLIGWGDERFYYSDGTDVWLGLDALMPPSPSVLHVAYDAAAASAYLGPNAEAVIPVSSEGAARFVAFLDRALVLGEDGAPVVTRAGKVVGRSAFLQARGSFHLFNVCNHWMARAIRAAGVDVNARTPWLASWLIGDLRRHAPERCPVTDFSGGG